MRKILVCWLILTACGAPAFAQSKKIDSLKLILKDEPQDTAAVLTSIILVEELWRVQNYPEALQLAQSAKSLAVELDYDRGTGLASLHSGIVFYLTADFRKGVEALNEAIELLGRSGTLAEQSLANHWAGNMFYRIGQFEKALTHYFRALSLREQLGDQRGIGFTLFNIANIYTAQKDYVKALDYHSQSLKIKEKLGDRRGVANSYNNIANIYYEQGQLDQALDYYTQALSIFKSLGNKQGVAYSQGNLGRIYKKKKQYPKALVVLREATILLEETGDKQGLLEANNELAQVHIFLREFDKAEAHLHNSEQLAKETGIEDKLIDTYLAYAQLDSARGNMAGALARHKQYTAKKESIFNTQKSNQITELQAAFDLERKDREIEFLSKEKELQESLANIQRTVFTVIILALLVIAGILVFFLYQKQKTNKILEEQKRYAENLNQFKDKLFSIISHDLRSPLSSLKGVLELASSHHLTEAELSSMLRTLGENTGHVTDLIDNLLHWARGHLSGETLNPEVHDLNALVKGTVDLLRPLSERKKLSVVNNISGSLPALCDRNMIEIVLRNLVSNAIKFTPSPGNIAIHGHANGSTVSVSVEDSGVGMLPEQVTKLFGNQTLTTRGTANEKGTGLGLILCREFLEKNGGMIGVESKSSGGSRFYFTLPAGTGQ